MKLTITSLAAALLSASAQDAVEYARTLSQLVQLTDEYNAEQRGEAVLTILPGESDVQKSNYDWRSCQIENTGEKRIAAVYIDVSTAMFGDMVFDSDGSGGDDVAKELSLDWGTTETNPISIDQYEWKWEPARADPDYDESAPFDPADLSNINNLFVNELSDSGLGGAGGYRGALILFKDFDGGETFEFSADMDPNSIAGLQQGTASIDAEWDVGGVSGAELINSVVTVLFGDGSTATGTIAADGSQAGGVAVVGNDLLAAPEMTVADRYTPGNDGTYSANPSVVVKAVAGSSVRVSMVRGFDPVDNQKDLANGKIKAEALVTARLEAQYPTFPVNNARQLQHVEVTMPSSGSIDVTSSFQFIGQDALAFTAVVIDSTRFPISTTSTPIRLTYVGQKVFCPQGQKLDGSGSCVQEWCNEDIQCPANAVRKPNRQCYNTVDDCECNSGFTLKNGQCVEQGVCPDGKKLDGSGFCVADWCSDNFQCPANSARKPNRQCYNTVDDCECASGFTLTNGQCVEQGVCPIGKKLDGSGFCVADWCSDNFQCPANSARKPDRQCYNTVDDCECASGFTLKNGQCVEQGACPNGKKLDGSGYCVEDWCNANFQCPSGKTRKPDRQCYDTIGDCQ